MLNSDEKQWMDSLYLVNKVGELVEYVLEPQLKSGIEKATEGSPIEVPHTARAHWNLLRYSYSFLRRIC